MVQVYYLTGEKRALHKADPLLIKGLAGLFSKIKGLPPTWLFAKGTLCLTPDLADKNLPKWAFLVP